MSALRKTRLPLRPSLFTGALVVLLLLPFLLVHLPNLESPYETQVANRLHPPNAHHWFGTDVLGRDLFSRTVHATRLSLTVSFQAFALALTLGLLFGGVAGFYHRRWPDRVVSWLISLLMTLPLFLLAAAIAAVVRPGPTGIYLLIGAVVWPIPARLARAEFIQLRQARFVLAQRAAGAGEIAIFTRTILPLAVVPPFAGMLFLIPELIALDVGLSFFGLGAQPPEPTLGRLIFSGLSHLHASPWLVLAPAATLLLLVALLFLLATRLPFLNRYRSSNEKN